MTVDLDVVGWVGEDHLCPGTFEKAGVGRSISRVAADQAMSANLPDIAGARHGRTLFDLRHVISRIGLSVSFVTEQDIDLGHFKAGDCDVEIEIEAGQMLQLDLQNLRIPPGFLGELVVGQDVGSLLCVVEMIEAHARHGLEPKRFGRFDAAMAGDDATILVDQDRVVESERLDARSDLRDLF